jgi:hypothetical protein
MMFFLAPRGEVVLCGLHALASFLKAGTLGQPNAFPLPLLSPPTPTLPPEPYSYLTAETRCATLELRLQGMDMQLELQRLEYQRKLDGLVILTMNTVVKRMEMETSGRLQAEGRVVELEAQVAKLEAHIGCLKQMLLGKLPPAVEKSIREATAEASATYLASR